MVFPINRLYYNVSLQLCSIVVLGEILIRSIIFQLACRSEIEQRALELMELLKDDRLLPLAAKYASRLGRVHLADKLSNLAETWEKDSDKLNVAQNSHFTELDTQETNDDTNAGEDLNASLIIPQKVKEKKVEAETTLKPIVSVFIAFIIRITKRKLTIYVQNGKKYV